jgi:hypothetical protein
MDMETWRRRHENMERRNEDTDMETSNEKRKPGKFS